MLKYTNSLVANHFFHTIWGKKSFKKIMDIKDNMDFPYINTKYTVFLSINLWFLYGENCEQVFPALR